MRSTEVLILWPGITGERIVFFAVNYVGGVPWHHLKEEV